MPLRHSALALSNYFEKLLDFFARLGAPVTTFLLSISLSVIAIAQTLTPNRDAMYYLEAAKAYQSGGINSAREIFDWLILSVAIGKISSIFNISVESVGYLLSTTCIAGASALIVSSVANYRPDLRWHALAIALTLPAFNVFRDDILRDHPTWLLVALFLWLIGKWEKSRDLKIALLSQAVLLASGLFRPESLVLLVAPILSGLSSRDNKKASLLQFALPPAMFAILTSTYLYISGIDLPVKILDQLSATNPRLLIELFAQKANSMTGVAIHKIAGGHASQILAFGLLSLLATKFLKNIGLLIIPLTLIAIRKDRPKPFLPPIYFWSLIAFLPVPVIFVLHMGFIIPRYMVIPAILLTPALAAGLASLLRTTPAKGKVAIWILCFLAALSNVISISPAKTHIIQAANWLKTQNIDGQYIFFADHEIAYLAGMDPIRALRNEDGFGNLPLLESTLAESRFQMFFLKRKVGDDSVEAWSTKNRMKIIERFSDGHKREILVLTPPPP